LEVMTGLFERLVMNIIKFYLATTLAKIAHLLAILAINVAGKGMVDIVIEGDYERIDWDCVGGAFLVISFFLIFWFITP